jgi:hypothetical protein
MKKLDVEDACETVAMENSVITGMVNFRNYPPKKKVSYFQVVAYLFGGFGT